MAVGTGLLFSCCGLFFALLLGAVVVRAATALANRIIGPVKTDDFGQWDDWDSDEKPASARNRRRGGEKAIPEPGFPTGLGIAFIVMLATVLAGGGLMVLIQDLVQDFFDGNDGLAVLAVVIFSTPIPFAVATLVVRAVLPTTFWRAALVTFLSYAIAAGMAAFAFCTIYGAWLLAER